jgi:tetrahydromethanopterin S-methyltransferase subunit G
LKDEKMPEIYKGMPAVFEQIKKRIDELEKEVK